MDPLSKRQWWAVLGVLTLALVLRLALIVTLADDPFFYDPIVDAAAYDKWAQEIAWHDFAGDRPFYQDPLYPYFLGVVYKLFGRDLALVRVLQAGLATFGCLMLFQIGRRLAGFRVGFVALCIAAVTKSLVFYDVALLKEMFGVLFAEAALLAVVSAGERGWMFALAGFVLGAGGLVRGNLLLLLPATAAWSRSWKRAGLVLGGGIIAILPVTIRNAAVGDFVITTAQLGPNLYIGNNPENTTGRYIPPSFLEAAAPGFEEEGFRRRARELGETDLSASGVDAFWRVEALHYIATRPFTFIAVTCKRALLLVNGSEIADNYSIPFFQRFSWILVPLLPAALLFPVAGLGVWIAWKRHPVLSLFLVTYAASILPFFVFARYRLPALPAVILFAAIALVETWPKLRQGLRSVTPATWAVLAAGALVVNAPIHLMIDVGPFDTATSHVNLGYLHLNRDNPAAAADELERAIEIRPTLANRPGVRYPAGLAHARAGNAKQAVEHLGKAAEMDPRNPLPQMELGRMHLRMGEPREAVKVLEEAVQRAVRHAMPPVMPRSVLLDAQILLGRAHVANKAPHEAVRVWDDAHRSFPKTSEPLLEKMRLYLQILPDEAARTAQEVLELQPANREAQAVLNR